MQIGLVHVERRMHRRRLHLQDDVAGLPDRARVRHDLRAGRHVIVVAKRGRGAGVVFDGHREAHLDQSRDVLRGDRHAAFAGAAFFRDGELHSGGIIRGLTAAALISLVKSVDRAGQIPVCQLQSEFALQQDQVERHLQQHRDRAEYQIHVR